MEGEFEMKRNMRRVWRKKRDIIGRVKKEKKRKEKYEILREYIDERNR